MSIDEAWAKFTTRKKICKYWEISCNKGNWKVQGSDLEKVTSEAMHYFQQYYSDGYYDEGGVVAKMMEGIRVEMDKAGIESIIAQSNTPLPTITFEDNK